MISPLNEGFAMVNGASKSLAGMLAIGAIFSATFSRAQCSINTVMVSGRIEHPPGKGLIRVQLLYQNQKKLGESAEATLDGELFRIQIPFVTQSRASRLEFMPVKCNRKPKTVVVTLLKADQEGDHEYDRISLDLAKDFRMADSSAYAPRSEILLHGPLSASAIQ
jgi:hypothetical protein